MNTAINVYEYGIGGKCVHKFRHTYAGIREMKMQLEKESRHMSRVMCTSIGTVTKLSNKFVRKENIQVIMNTELNTKQAARATQVERQVEKKVYTHDKHS